MTFTIEQLEALKEGTAPGPWEWRVGEKVAYRHELVDENGAPVLACGALRWPDEPDESLIAASPTLLDQLIAREAELQKLREEMALLASKVGVRAANAQTNGAFSSAVAFRETASAITKILEGNE